MNHRVDRAVFFVDGSNFYHGCEKLPLSNLGRLNFAKVCTKLVGPRQWTATRYYVGQVPPTGNLALSADQKKFFGFLTSCDPRISVHLGRIEQRRAKSEAAEELGPKQARFHTASWHHRPDFRRHGSPRRPRSRSFIASSLV